MAGTGSRSGAELDSVVAAGARTEPPVPRVEPRMIVAERKLEALARGLEHGKHGAVGDRRRVARQEGAVADVRLEHVEKLRRVRMQSSGDVRRGLCFLGRKLVRAVPQPQLEAGHEVAAEALGFLRRAGGVAPEQIGTVALSPRAARELDAAHRRLISGHLEKELKSARVLREMRQAGAGR